MTVTMTAITKHQWYKIAKVLFWLVLSGALASGTAWLTNNVHWVATMPAYNLVLYMLSMIFQQEESQAQEAVSLTAPVSTVTTVVAPSTPPETEVSTPTPSGPEQPTSV